MSGVSIRPRATAAAYIWGKVKVIIQLQNKERGAKNDQETYIKTQTDACFTDYDILPVAIQ